MAESIRLRPCEDGPLEIAGNGPFAKPIRVGFLATGRSTANSVSCRLYACVLTHGQRICSPSEKEATAARLPHERLAVTASRGHAQTDAVPIMDSAPKRS